MTIYTVLAPQRAPETPPDPTAFVFVKEGLCWPALFFPPVWLIFREMWLVLLVYLAGVVAIALLAAASADAVAAVTFGLAWLLFALEANGLRRWTLERRGFELIGVAAGSSARDAELRFFMDLPAEPPAVPAAPVVQRPEKAPPTPPSAEAGEVIGLFPTPGGAA